MSVHTAVLTPKPKPERSQKIGILYRVEELRGSCHTGCTQVKSDLSLTKGDSRAQEPAGTLLSLDPPEPPPSLPLLPPAQPRQQGQLKTRQAQHSPAKGIAHRQLQVLPGLTPPTSALRVDLREPQPGWSVLHSSVQGFLRQGGS